ncbi:acyl carrier protein [Aureibaculum sp. A20]|uniref:Acyl carrier protein n=1 Tax=Aureibaculum flavum TaxID=2795986 RepID=A0ABS0WKU8_9FLAO|nr:acyl carrier protein [Aureibaculum flavum]MBJ2172603.1 acyl carrier protein [Aureibaculum flavum]
MEKSQIKDELDNIFKKIFNNETLEISENMSANDVDNWDSLSHMLLITEIEDHFSIKFKLRELNKMKNVGVLIDILSSKLN